MQGNLVEEFRYYVAHQEEFVSKYRGKVIVLKDQTVIGVYDSELEAFETASKEHEPGTFLVQVCEPGPESYTQTFHSRVAFA